MSKFTDERDRLEAWAKEELALANARLEEERDEYKVKGAVQWAKDNWLIVAVGVVILAAVLWVIL